MRGRAPASMARTENTKPIAVAGEVQAYRKIRSRRRIDSFSCALTRPSYTAGVRLKAWLERRRLFELSIFTLSRFHPFWFELLGVSIETNKHAPASKDNSNRNEQARRIC